MKIVSRRTLLVLLLVVCLIDMIQAGVIDDVKEFLHYEQVKKFGKDAAQKTGEVATSAFHSVKDFIGGTTADPTTPATTSTNPPK